ncbi:hypothetical protein P879_04440 [Paragonimus westermani]|uniref:Uncharacterized protein n=1 Tax=Paragonimus westermani TaxID=34504 RepID=A0A8T0D0T3_9TREM|nr:hypothetical protein P879_04440 [Paragonimus westermani]
MNLTTGSNQLLHKQWIYDHTSNYPRDSALGDTCMIVTDPSIQSSPVFHMVIFPISFVSAVGMKRKVVFSESDSDSDFETKKEGIVSKSSSKRQKRKEKSDVIQGSTDGRDRVQLSILQSLQNVALSKTDIQKHKSGSSTLERYFSPKTSRADVKTPKRTEISADEFFCGSKQKNNSTKLDQKTPPHTPLSIIPDTPAISPGNLIPDTPSPPSSRKPTPHRSQKRSEKPTHVKAEKADVRNADEIGSPAHLHTPKVDTETTPHTPISRKPFWAYQARDGPRALGSKPIPKVCVAFAVDSGLLIVCRIKDVRLHLQMFFLIIITNTFGVLSHA